jgi:hypothetical protein
MDLKEGALVDPTVTTTARVYVGVDVSPRIASTSACDGANPKAAKTSSLLPTMRPGSTPWSLGSSKSAPRWCSWKPPAASSEQRLGLSGRRELVGSSGQPSPGARLRQGYG